jgi:hypothetical protein
VRTVSLATPLALEREVFATADPRRIAALVDRFCRENLGSGAAAYEFFATSAGSVHGLRLEDRRRVVVKVYRPDVDATHLAAVQRVQTQVADDGFPSPRPLLAPTPLARGLAIVEATLDRGTWADAHEPAARKAVAAALVRLVEHARPTAGLVSWRDAYDRLWRRPHDARFDFPGTAQGAEWIDRLAAVARRRLDDHAAGDTVVGHGDWRAEHLRFANGALSAVYDWDSLAVAHEPVFTGAAAHAFTANWSIEGHPCIPTIEESLAFIADYEAARANPFTDAERRTALNALVATMAYSARCEHCGRASGPIPETGCLGILARHGDRLLDLGAPPGHPA